MRKEAVEGFETLPISLTAEWEVQSLNSYLVLRSGLIHVVKCLSATHWPLTMPGRVQDRGWGDNSLPVS